MLCVRKKVKGRLVDILYISSLRGNFVTGEYINVINDGVLDGDRKTFISGSLNSVIVSDIGVGSGYNIGDIVDYKLCLWYQRKRKSCIYQYNCWNC